MEEKNSREYGRFSQLSPDQAEQIHNASLEILERIGVRMHLPEAVELLRKAGARVEEGNRVHIPAERVRWAIHTAPKQVSLFNRRGKEAIVLREGQCYYGPGSDCLNIIDHRDGFKRKPILADVAEGTRLCDALEHIDFVMSMVLPTDVDQTLADVYQMEVMLANTIKPIVYVSYETEGLKAAVEMAEAVMGGDSALRMKPILTCYINVVSGATHNETGLQKLIYLAKKGLPILYIPGSNAGVTSPMTMAGAVALDLAGGLAGLVLAQLEQEGSPYIISGMDPAALDMRTMVSPYAYPERGIIQAMGKRDGLPTFSLAGGSDSKLVDQQAAAEAALTLLGDTLMGGNLIHDLGYLESGLCFSFAQLAICNEIVSWIKAFLKPINVSEETLALDIIEKDAGGGHYLRDAHTRRHIRDHWYPVIFERGTYADWAARGGLSLGERAALQVERALGDHQPEPLSKEASLRLAEIVRRAESTAKTRTKEK